MYYFITINITVFRRKVITCNRSYLIVILYDILSCRCKTMIISLFVVSNKYSRIIFIVF
nr:MAG TPA: hypothetical protein [Bacteriophage sp.]